MLSKAWILLGVIIEILSHSIDLVSGIGYSSDVFTKSEFVIVN